MSKSRFAIEGSFEKQSSKMAVQLGFDAPNGSQMMARWRNQQELLESFEGFGQKMQYGENANWERMRVFDLLWLLLGLEWQKMWLIFAV